MSHVYCFDSGVFINSWRKTYPPDVFPCVWRCLDQLCADGKVIIPQLVYDEIEVKGDDLFDWLKTHKSAVVSPDPAVIMVVKSIMKTHGRLVDNKPNRSGADPFVIAHAQVTGTIVVTEEQESRGHSPRIPDVCRALGVPFTRTLDVLRACKVVAS